MSQQLVIQTERGQLDVYENSIINITYAIADITDPSKRKSSFSKKYTIPGTPTNRNIFGYVDRLESNDGYNFNKKMKATISVDGVTILQGHLQLESSVRIDETEDLEYNIVFYSDIADLFADIGNDTIQDLYDYDIPMTWEHVRNYSKSDYNKQYYFPGLFYGHNQDQTEYRISEISPSFRISTIFDDIMNRYGFNYNAGQGDWKTDIDNLYLVSSGKKVKNEETILKHSTNLPSANGSNFLFSEFYNQGHDTLGGSTTMPPVYLISSVWGNNQEVNGSDIIGADNVTLSGTKANTWVCPRTGYYNIDTNFLLTFVYYDADSGRRFRWTGDGSIDVNFELRLNGVRIANTVSQSTGNYATFIPSEAVKNCSTSYTIFDTWGIQPYSMAKEGVYLEEGDQITTHFGYHTFDSGSKKIKWSGSCGDGLVQDSDIKYMPVVYQSNGDQQSYFKVEYATDGFIEDDIVSVKDFLPKTKIKDFLKGLINMYNLQIYNTDERELYIDTYKDFYGSNGIIDWTDKVDRSQEMEIEYLPDFTFRSFEYKFKTNKSRRGVAFKEKQGVEIGSATYDIDNDFRNKTKTMELPFVNIGYDIEETNNTLYSEDLAGLESGQYKPTGMDNVIGRKRTEYSYKYYPKNTIGGAYPGGGTQYVNYYHTISMSADNYPALRFGSNSSSDNNNLFTTYHREYFDEITNINSKLVTANIYLTPIDLIDFDFRKLIMIDNKLFKVSKIKNYNPVYEGVTEVELITVINKNELVAQNIDDKYKLDTRQFQSSDEQSDSGLGLDIGIKIESRGDDFSLNVGDNIRSYGDGLFIGSDIQMENIRKTTRKNIPLMIQGYQIEEQKLSKIGVSTAKNNVLIESGLDIVENPFKQNETDIIDGGEDVIRNPYGDIRNRIIIDNGLDS